MIKEFAPYPESLELKELGFDKPCFGYYVGLGDNKEEPFKLVEIQSEKGQFEWIDNVYHAPTFSQAFRFFRENYPELDFGFAKIYNGTNNYHYHINLQWEFFEGTYEEAELECLRKLILIVKEKQNE